MTQYIVIFCFLVLMLIHFVKCFGVFRGNLGATHVRLENPAHPVKYQGVVCSMKESFGFIERADVVKEIFFHFSEAKTKEELQLGDDVEFIIQTRNVSMHWIRLKNKTNKIIEI